MRTRVLSILGVLVVALSFSLIAQTPEETQPPVAASEDLPPAAEQTATTPQVPAAQESGPAATATDADGGLTGETEGAMGEGGELPKTASSLALLALLGLGSASTAAGLRLARRR